MKDFPFWRGAIQTAQNPVALKTVGEELAQFQGQTQLLNDGEKRLTPDQVAALRKIYSNKLKDFKEVPVATSSPRQEEKPHPEAEESVEAVVCIKCGQPIPVERLEAVPATKKCVKCQEKAESGEEQRPQASKCKRCGSVMVWRMTKNVKPAKYFLGCSNYPKCTYIGVSAF